MSKIIHISGAANLTLSPARQRNKKKNRASLEVLLGTETHPTQQRPKQKSKITNTKVMCATNPTLRVSNVVPHDRTSEDPEHLSTKDGKEDLRLQLERRRL